MPYADPEKARAYRKAWSVKNQDKLRAQGKLWRDKNKERIANVARKWTSRNRKLVSDKARRWQLKQKALGKCTWCGKPSGEFQRCEEHRKWFRKYSREYRNKNIVIHRQRERESAQRRLKNQRLAFAIRKRLNEALKSQKSSKIYSALRFLGCPVPDFKMYLESLFEPGMSWENWGNKRSDWNLDHIIPIALFDLTKESHQRRCFHFSNYQPLWRDDNFSKGIKAPKSHQFDLL
jgi:hypothetical protein